MKKKLHSALLKELSLFSLCFLLLFFSCAKMGSPDGGWYDETPPHVVRATPENKGVNVDRKKIYIYFNEYVTIENPTENVVISPPQIEMPTIKGQGKRISVELIDSLKPNTTYTIDFSSAISDNNEGNPMNNYTYSFSTGDHIDTMEVAGYVLQADNLEPVKGILVGLYDNLSDSVFKKEPMLRVSKTDSRGRFSIKGVAPGKYRIYALKDAEGDYVFSQKSEMIAFSNELIEPSFRPDTRQDTTWLDSLRIASIQQVPYTHFLPDDVCLRAFEETQTNRYLIKSERVQANHFTLYYSYGDEQLPQLRGLNFNADGAFIIDATPKQDTITYWLRDTALINRDTLQIEFRHHITDTLGVLRMQTDTLMLLAKKSYEKRLKEQQKAKEDWEKKERRKKNKGEPYDSIMPITPLALRITPDGMMDPDQNVYISAATPLQDADTTYIHLYAQPKGDSLWYKERYILERQNAMTYELRAEWRPDTEYSLEADSAVFTDIYGLAAQPLKLGLKVRSFDEYATLTLTLTGMNGKKIVAQLLDKSDKVVREASSSTGEVKFFYVKGGTYYLRMFIDENGNGQWDTGDYDAGRQPEAVYYYTKEIECRKKWDVILTWNPTAKPLYMQKPGVITKQKAEKEKTIKRRNVERARKLGKEYIPKL